MNWFARIVMGLLGLFFLAGLLAALSLYIVFATFRWLLTGRKPQVVLVWQQFSAKLQHQRRCNRNQPTSSHGNSP